DEVLETGLPVLFEVLHRLGLARHVDLVSDRSMRRPTVIGAGLLTGLGPSEIMNIGVAQDGSRTTTAGAAQLGATAVAGILVAVTVIMLIVPLPTFVVDGLIALNLGLSIALLAAALLARGVLELSSLPTVLVLLTLFRLALNVTSVRLIL